MNPSPKRERLREGLHEMAIFIFLRLPYKSTKKMKAVVYTEYGAPKVLKVKNIEKPTPKANEILIKIKASSVARADAMMRTGKPYIGRLFLGLTKPKNYITGTGLAGDIEAIGNDVTRFKIGDVVFGEMIFGLGTNAEYVCVPEDGILALKPSNISYEEAAPVCDGVLTSLSLLKDIANIQSGQKVLIIGASGSLGTAAVQLAKHFGAEVTGICSGKNIALVKSLGTDKMIDYTKTDFTKNGKTYDIIYDTVGKSSFQESKQSLTEKGAYLSPVLDFQLLLKVLWTSIFGKKKALFSATGTRKVSELRALLQDIKSLMALGKIKSVIDKVYSLEEIVEAHEYVDTGRKVGNIVIKNQ
ncbi:MAG: NADPH:quinone reductase-like Zn-dependent oxidoreductase [Cognaticolwellia sp.]